MFGGAFFASRRLGHDLTEFIKRCLSCKKDFPKKKF
jgi:hypothetical protein